MVVDFSANETEATLVELNPSTYNIRVFAKSIVGTSNASNVLTVTTEGAGVWRLNVLSQLFFRNFTPICSDMNLPALSDFQSEDLWTTVSTNVAAAVSSHRKFSNVYFF